MTQTRPQNLAARPGFTLVEMLIVIGIIVLMVAIALPAFRAITGGRSEEGATNQITAMLARARADAVGLQQPRGVAFYTDPAGQCRLSEIGAVAFSGWAGVNAPYSKGSYVSYQPPAAGKVQYYVCISPVLAVSNVDISDTTHWHQFVANGSDTPASPEYAWAAVWSGPSAVLFDQVPDTDAVALPLGVAAQVIADDSAVSGTATAASDRYLHDGVLLFDASGRLAYQSLVLSQYGLVGSAVGYNLENRLLTTPFLLPSSFGLVVYDRQAHDSQNFPPHDPTFDATVTYTSGTPSPKDEEAWLDVNATPLLINRYTGSLVRGE